jgi:hypothetical protein
LAEIHGIRPVRLIEIFDFVERLNSRITVETFEQAETVGIEIGRKPFNTLNALKV